MTPQCPWVGTPTSSQGNTSQENFGAVGAGSTLRRVKEGAGSEERDSVLSRAGRGGPLWRNLSSHPVTLAVLKRQELHKPESGTSMGQEMCGPNLTAPKARRHDPRPGHTCPGRWPTSLLH